MDRIAIIQKIINHTGARVYLEIGVFRGQTFLRIKAREKIAVDPNFAISQREKRRWRFKNLSNLWARYYPETSDDFFANHRLKKPVDVAFIDGLHTHEQSLKDVEQVLAHGHPKSVLILHDCNPPNEIAAMAAQSFEHVAELNLPGWTEEWCGDVWKTICYLRAFRDDLQVFVLDCDYGLGIITTGKPETKLDFTREQFNRLAFADLAINRNYLLNLKAPNYLDHFLASF